MPDITLRLTYVVDTVVTLSPQAQHDVLAEFYRKRAASGRMPDNLRMLPLTAPALLVLGVVIGEATSHAIATKVPQVYPSKDVGVTLRIPSISYQETPEKLIPPENTVPHVVALGDRRAA